MRLSRSLSATVIDQDSFFYNHDISQRNRYNSEINQVALMIYVSALAFRWIYRINLLSLKLVCTFQYFLQIDLYATYKYWNEKLNSNSH